MSEDTKNSKTSNEDIYVIGVHILFGIVIATIFETFNSDLFPIQYNFQSVMIFLAFGTIILSWIGYNGRINKFGHNSAVLFSIDLIIVYLYFNLIFSIKHSFSDFLLGFVLIFGFYILWDIVKGIQDHVGFFQNTSTNLLKTKLEISSFLVLLGLWLGYTFLYSKIIQYPFSQSTITEYGMIVIVIVVIVLFRSSEPPFNKYWPQRNN